MYGIIYKATNKVNGKVYIGQTKNTLQIRKKSHIDSAFSKLSKKFPFQYAIRKYGREGFHWEEIDRASTKDELNEKEINWIKDYGACGTKGYNVSLGGAFSGNQYKPVLVYTIEGVLLKKVDSATFLANELNCLPGDVGKACKGTPNNFKGYIVFYERDWSDEALKKELAKRVQKEKNRNRHSGKRKIVAFKPNGKRMDFDSLYQASLAFGSSRKSIRDVCDGKTFSVKKHIFFYHDSIPSTTSPEYPRFLQNLYESRTQPKARLSIYRLDKTGKLIEFSTKMECVSSSPISNGKLNDVIYNGTHYWKGYFYFEKYSYTRAKYNKLLKKEAPTIKPSKTTRIKSVGESA